MSKPSKRKTGRPPTPESIRLAKARTARRIVDEELAAMKVPQLEQAKNRAAMRLKISARTLLYRLADAPAGSTPADIGAALMWLANSGLPGSRGLDKIVTMLERHLDPSNLVIDCGEY